MATRNVKIGVACVISTLSFLFFNSLVIGSESLVGSDELFGAVGFTDWDSSLHYGIVIAYLPEGSHAPVPCKLRFFAVAAESGPIVRPITGGLTTYIARRGEKDMVWFSPEGAKIVLIKENVGHFRNDSLDVDAYISLRETTIYMHGRNYEYRDSDLQSYSSGSETYDVKSSRGHILNIRKAGTSADLLTALYKNGVLNSVVSYGVKADMEFYDNNQLKKISVGFSSEINITYRIVENGVVASFDHGSIQSAEWRKSLAAPVQREESEYPYIISAVNGIRVRVLGTVHKSEIVYGNGSTSSTLTHEMGTDYVKLKQGIQRCQKFKVRGSDNFTCEEIFEHVK